MRTSNVMAMTARPNGPIARVTGQAAMRPTRPCSTASSGTPSSAHQALRNGSKAFHGLNAEVRASRRVGVLIELECTSPQSTPRSREMGSLSPRPVGGRPLGCLPLGVLRRLPGPLQAVLLALLHARVAGQKACLLERWPQLLVFVDQRPGDAVGNRSGLPGDTAALDLDADIEATERLGQPQRLQHNLLQPALPEVLHRALLVDQDPTIAGLDADACDRRLAAADGPNELLLRQPGCPPSH